MNIGQFFKFVEAQLVGGKIKAVWEGIHHVIAEIVEGSPQLTAVGQKLKDDIEAGIPDVAPAVETVVNKTLDDTLSDPAIDTVAKVAADEAIKQVADIVQGKVPAKRGPKPKTPPAQ